MITFTDTVTKATAKMTVVNNYLTRLVASAARERRHGAPGGVSAVRVDCVAESVA